MDLTSIIASEPTKKEEMSRLAARFAAQMCKWVAGCELRARRVSLPLCLMGNVQSGLQQMKRLKMTRQ